MKAAILSLTLLLVGAVAAAPCWAAAAAEAGKAAAGAQPDDHADHGLGHGHPSTDPAEVKSDLAIFSAIVFLLLVVILRKFAWKPISEGLEKRENHIAHEIHAAEKANADAKLLLAEYQKKLDEAQAQVRAIVEEARRDAEQTQQDIIAKAKAEAAAETARGKREIDTAKDQAMRELAQVAADQALALAGKLLQQQIKPADHARLIEESLAKFPTSQAHLN